MKLIILFGLLVTSCFRHMKPEKDFEYYPLPKEPDYNNEYCWAALPDRNDWADYVPLHSSLKDHQKEATADVFFIHPTTCLDKKCWNGDVYDTALNSSTDKTCIVYEATVFNESCKVYAPRYRQATLYSFFDAENGEKALAIAYSDVKKAFQYYLIHYNNGRPIIIASHSQGTRHAIELLKDFFDDDPLMRKRLIAAYLIGGKVHKNEFKNISACDSENQLGCFISWNCFCSGNFQDYSECECTNPLTWKRNTEYASSYLNAGSVPVSFDRIDVNIADAVCKNGKLKIHKLKVEGYPSILFSSYHLVDYGLFYMNLRQNVALRIRTFYQNKKMI